MQEVAAYLLLVLGGTASPTADDVKGVLTAGGIEEPSDEQITALITDLAGKDIDELLTSGMEKLKDVPMGGSGGGGGGGGGGDGGAEAEVEKVEEKEVEEEMDLGGGMDMFGGDDAEGGDY
mmetsp:Transcript_24813/g.29252  ORF Transcript_24813/g.29252 Transcript_24813/m.29252 type:complete len:121 (+) Transcript_24813:94-456(+)|eukprot:CAMPEP_0198251430 /NCGR_PEP_ID=MMETSP1447-20131203/2265_1 /TAXON_ID=420782 /ORGANISM="Chaetoceros dichaeta, Strain CCMP1751" /LENGTH=120 /DNA_ID=CAMNT_0043936449 /DNA_START=210 /DNA_END=572 /DNA_ORIENTATION=+